MKKLSLLLVLVSITISCSSPLDKLYNERTVEQDAKEIKESGKLSDEDAKLLIGWILKSKLSGKEIEGKSYSEIIKDAKNFKKEQRELAEKTKREEEAKRQRLGSALTVAMYKKGYQEYDYQEYITYSLAFENKTDKEIRALKGKLTINDLFDTKIKSISLTIDERITSKGTHKGTYTTDYNQFKDEDVRLKSKDLDDLKVVWTPEKIIFSDGTTLE